MADYISAISPVNYPYAKIVFGPLTDDSFSVSTDAVDNRPKYFISLSHERIINKAATISFTLSFAPHNTMEFEDADALEMMISSKMGLCTIEYGWTINDTNKYWVMLTTYTITFNNGVITYTFKGITQSALFNDSLIHITYDTTTGNVSDFLEYLKKQIEYYTNERYTLNISKCTRNFKLPDYEIDISDYSVMGVLNTLVNSFLGLDEDTTNKYLCVIVDDKITNDIDSNVSEIYIKLCDVYKDEVNAHYSFAWNDPNGGVIDFNVTYDGAVAMNMVRADASNSENFNYETSVIMSNGAPQTITTKGLATSKDKYMLSELSQINHIENYSKYYWAQKSNYPYDATLTVLGNTDASVEITDKIHVDVLLGLTKHHTSGTYFVTKIIDTISGNGFTTQYSMKKIEADSDAFATLHRSKGNILEYAITNDGKYTHHAIKD